MKKILTLAILFLLSINIVAAKEKNNYHIKFDGVEYNLLYSTKNPEFGGYLNEYYKWNETYNNWSEMIAVHHFPNAYSPIDQVKSFREYLGSLNCPSALTFDEDKNIALIDFIMINDHRLPIVLEFNVFKYEKSKKCGSVAIQYAKRYVVTTAFQMEAAKKDFDKIRKRALKQVKNFNVPEIVYKEIDKCKIEDEPKEIIPVSDIKQTEDQIQEESVPQEESIQEESTKNEDSHIEVESEDDYNIETDTEEQKEVKDTTEENNVTKTDTSVDEKAKEIIEITGDEPPHEGDIQEEESLIIIDKKPQPSEYKSIKTTQEKDITKETKEIEPVQKEHVDSEYREPEIATPDNVENNVKKVSDKVEAVPEYSPIQIKEYTSSTTTYETTKIKSEKNIKPIKQKKQKKVSAKKRAKEAAKKLAQ